MAYYGSLALLVGGMHLFLRTLACGCLCWVGPQQRREPHIFTYVEQLQTNFSSQFSKNLLFYKLSVRRPSINTFSNFLRQILKRVKTKPTNESSGLVGSRKLKEGIRTAEPVHLVQRLGQELKLELVLAGGQLLARHRHLTAAVACS